MSPPSLHLLKTAVPSSMIEEDEGDIPPPPLLRQVMQEHPQLLYPPRLPHSSLVKEEERASLRQWVKAVLKEEPSFNTQEEEDQYLHGWKMQLLSHYPD